MALVFYFNLYIFAYCEKGVKINHSTCLGVSVATCMAILQVGSGLQLRSASTGTKEEDYENDAATIVQKCVSIKQILSVNLCISWDKKPQKVLLLFSTLLSTFKSGFLMGLQWLAYVSVI